jgi:hypothetical protein
MVTKIPQARKKTIKQALPTNALAGIAKQVITASTISFTSLPFFHPQ